jgi:glycosyltransferase involved in cell wall biosynthesis
MRIGMILDKTFPPDPRVENEADALIKSSHQVFLFCLKYKDELDSEIINGIQVKRYLSNKIEYKLSALAYTLPFYTYLMTKKIRHFIADNKIEALHIHDIRVAEAVFNANIKLKLPVVLDLHDNMPEVMKLYPHLQKFPGKQIISPQKWKKKEEEFITKADKVISVSKEFIEEVVQRTKIAKNKIILVPNTVRKAFYQDIEINNQIIKKYKDSFVILYLGDTGLRRGLQTAIESVKKLKDEIKNLPIGKVSLKLVIVGKNTTDNILKAQVKELNLEKFVDFEGWQDVSLFPSYILASDICISPLYRNMQHDVAYANKLFQYMSFAKPILVSDATAQKNLVLRTNSGLVHKEKDPTDFAEKVLKLYNDTDLQKELGENGKKFVENEFCWEKVSDNLVEIYNEFEKKPMAEQSFK